MKRMKCLWWSAALGDDKPDGVVCAGEQEVNTIMAQHASRFSDIDRGGSIGSDVESIPEQNFYFALPDAGRLHKTN